MLLKKKNEFYGKEKNVYLHFYLVLSAIKIKYPLICILKKRAKFENI